MTTATKKQPADLTQAEAYALYGSYGGCVDAKARSQINHLLAEMSYPEEPVANVRAEVGDRLYFPAVRALEQLLARAAAGEPENPPPEPRPRRTRDEAARDAVVERATTRKEWAKLVERAKQPAEAKK